MMTMIKKTTLNCRRLLPTKLNLLASRLRMETKKSPDRTASLCSGKRSMMRKKLKRKRSNKRNMI